MKTKANESVVLSGSKLMQLADKGLLTRASKPKRTTQGRDTASWNAHVRKVLSLLQHEQTAWNFLVELVPGWSVKKCDRVITDSLNMDQDEFQSKYCKELDKSLALKDYIDYVFFVSSDA